MSEQCFSHLDLIELQRLRNVDYALLSLSSGVNMFYGANGAGKTTVCEALSLLFHGRSFRSASSLSALTQKQSIGFQIKARVAAEASHSTSIFMQKKRAESWVVSRDNVQQKRLQDITRLLPVMILSPDFDNLLDTPPEGRRQCLDWLMFHVEHSFSEHAKLYAQSIKQRNKLLRVKSKFDSELFSWTQTMIQHGEIIASARARVMPQVIAKFEAGLEGTQFEGCSLVLNSGWRSGDFASAVDGVQQMELRRKMTLLGPHRADFSIVDSQGRLLKPFLSRGEKKRLSVQVTLAFIECLYSAIQQKVILIIDDWRAELDHLSRENILQRVSALGLQVLVTTTEKEDQQYLDRSAKMFHVEHGQFREISR